MRTIQKVVSDILPETPFFEEGLALGILNLSALARYLKPRITKETYTRPTDAAVIMALSRISRTAKKRIRKNELKTIKQFSVRTGLIEYAFHPSVSLLPLQQKIVRDAETKRDVFVNLTHGVSEVNLIVSESLAPAVEKLIPKHGVIDTIRDLAAITMKLRREHIYTSGVHYALLKALAWENINLIESISTYSEMTVVVESKNLARAFGCLQRATGNQGSSE